MAMNRSMHPDEPVDAEILAGVRRHLIHAEEFIPEAPRWTAEGRVRAGRPVLRSRLAFGGAVPLVLAAGLVAVVIGQGLGWRPASSVGAVPTTNLPGAVANITYRLAPADGQQPSDNDLNADAAALSKRLSFFFPVTEDAAGSQVSGPSVDYEVIAAPPDQIVVRFEADYRAEAGALLLDASWIRASLGLTGAVEVVGLPDSVYGTVGLAGSLALPQPGSSVVTPVSLLSATDVQGAYFPGSDTPDAGTYLGISLIPVAAQRLADYAATNVGQYLAVLVDGRVFATTAISGPVENGVLKIAIGAGLSTENGATIHFLLANGPALSVPVTEVEYGLTGPSPLPPTTGSLATPTQILVPTTSAATASNVPTRSPNPSSAASAAP
jgi:hypothetical protein